MTFLETKELGKRLGARFTLRGVSLAVAKGEVFGIVGPSGAGKTTLLRLIAGLEIPDEGEVFLDGERMSSPRRANPPEARRVGMVFQSLALWGHLTSLEHLDLVMRPRIGDALARKAGAMELLAQARLEGLENARPGGMSGGEKQRLALARAVAPHPRLLLLDEPFAHVDAPLRDELASDFLDLIRSLGVTTLLVSHDGANVSELCSRVAVMNGGRFLQSGAPRDVYERPESPAAALMTGPAFLLAGRADGMAARTEAGAMTLCDPGGSGPGHVCLRPESFNLEDINLPGPGEVTRILRCAFVAGRWKSHFLLGEVELWTWEEKRRLEGSHVRVSVLPAVWIPE